MPPAAHSQPHHGQQRQCQVEERILKRCRITRCKAIKGHRARGYLVCHGQSNLKDLKQAEVSKGDSNLSMLQVDGERQGEDGRGAGCDDGVGCMQLLMHGYGAVTAPL